MRKGKHIPPFSQEQMNMENRPIVRTLIFLSIITMIQGKWNMMTWSHVYYIGSITVHGVLLL